MIENNSGIAVINRGFWPTYPVIGDALLGLAEELAKYTSVTVMTQSSPGLALKLSRLGRGQNVIFRVALVNILYTR